MQWINYTICNKVNLGTEEKPNWHETLIPARCRYSEAGLAVIKNKAHNGEYTVEDDGIEPTAEEQIAALKAQLAATDYTVIKIAEGAATMEEYADVIAQRRAWRAQINELEMQ